MRERPKPLLGALLGLLIGFEAAALLTVLGIAPADQTVVWGLASLGALLGTVALTQRLSLAPRRVLVAMIAVGAAAGMALAGLPEYRGGGHVSEGCYLTLDSASQEEAVTPEQTSAREPFRIAQGDVLVWDAASDEVLTLWNSTLGIRVSGRELTLWTAEYENEDEATEFSGAQRMRAQLSEIEEDKGFAPVGTYHLVGELQAAEGMCTLDLYVRIEPEGLFDGFIMMGLWALAAALVLTFLVLAYDVRSSIKDADTSHLGAHIRERARTEPSAQEPHPGEVGGHPRRESEDGATESGAADDAGPGPGPEDGNR
ncbi:hypothetical protein [Demequina sp. NBRC 110054]|uniref:hypothetical protein n=1 Tax=Demequina sp. NBRC 110054 TaxID=1570343 RepID=UPI000A0735B1|nr:hypothetical protein [Demequina sp. NBRC 110054]